jgi:hypothetical protein
MARERKKSAKKGPPLQRLSCGVDAGVYRDFAALAAHSGLRLGVAVTAALRRELQAAGWVAYRRGSAPPSPAPVEVPPAPPTGLEAPLSGPEAGEALAVG